MLCEGCPDLCPVCLLDELNPGLDPTFVANRVLSPSQQVQLWNHNPKLLHVQA